MVLQQTTRGVAAQWCQVHDGALLAHMNRVPCVGWCTPSAVRLSKGDRALRKWCGWYCVCCPDDGEEPCAAVGLIGRQLEAGGQAVWTRWGFSHGEINCKARLDLGLAFGAAKAMCRAADSVRAGQEVSDHALICFKLAVAPPRGAKGEVRPLPVNLGGKPQADRIPDDTSAWHVFRQLSHEEEFLDGLRSERSSVVQRVPGGQPFQGTRGAFGGNCTHGERKGKDQHGLLRRRSPVQQPQRQESVGTENKWLKTSSGGNNA